MGASNRESEALRENDGPDSQSRVAGTLHEVSNALTVVLGWLERAAEGTSLEEVQLAVRVAQEHARRGRGLARRSIGAESPPECQRRLASDVAEFAVLSVEPQAEAQSVRVRSNVESGNDACLEGDDVAVQVITNLLLNAIDFSPVGQTVDVSLHRTRDSVRFLIEDRGPGVAHELLPRLFDQGVTTRSEGAGIGLPLSRRLARDRGGDLWLENPGAPGARFVLEWPLAPPARVLPLSCGPVQESRLALEGLGILVIEDDQAIISLVQLTLEARGAEVTVIDSSEMIDEVLSQRPAFDLVLLDLSPVAHRLSEVLERIRIISASAPILLMSGEPSGIPEEGRGRIHSWIRKPFDMGQLVDSARSALAERN